MTSKNATTAAASKTSVEDLYQLLKDFNAKDLFKNVDTILTALTSTHCVPVMGNVSGEKKSIQEFTEGNRRALQKYTVPMRMPPNNLEGFKRIIACQIRDIIGRESIPDGLWINKDGIIVEQNEQKMERRVIPTRINDVGGNKLVDIQIDNGLFPLNGCGHLQYGPPTIITLSVDCIISKLFPPPPPKREYTWV